MRNRHRSLPIAVHVLRQQPFLRDQLCQQRIQHILVLRLAVVEFL